MRSYSSSSASLSDTPPVTYLYDTATYGVGRLRSITAQGVSVSNYTAYDRLGRVTAYNQITGNEQYAMTNSYNKAGMLVDETYPSGRGVHTEYDDAGRIAGARNQNNLYYAGAAASDSLNRIQYTPHGGASLMKLGNQTRETFVYNSRLQATQMELRKSHNSLLLGLDYGFSTSDNNGYLLSQTIRTGSATFSQTYSYDRVNRLQTA